MSMGYADVIWYEMPTKRSKRFVAPRTSQAPARKYNRRTRTANVARSEIATAVVAERVIIAQEADKLHNCMSCGRSYFGSIAEFRLIHGEHK